MTNEPSISDAEWQVMNVIWETSPASAADVIAALEPAVDWSPRTVKTLLHRLVKKRVLAFERQGQHYLYRALVGRDACVRQASRSFVSRVFGGDVVPMVEFFVKDGALSRAELQRLRRLLDEGERRDA